ncbi:MAG: sugar transferase [Pirellulales bacterium]|nr:sugar transferase [Pirellulales bacterium]
MTQQSAPRPFHASLLPRRRASLMSRRRQIRFDYFLSDADFRFAAQCERMRVDRNGSILSLLIIRLPRDRAAAPDIEFLGRVLEGRLRITDTPGMLRNGDVAVLLPDTNAEGAWKVAEDVSEVYPPGPERPECEVFSYPGRRRRRHAETEEDAAVVSGEDAELDPGEFFFARPMPLWKRCVDVAGSLAGLAVAAPVVGVAAAAIKLTSPGPAFFLQEREGLGGKRFKIYKLRTMSVDAEHRKRELRASSEQDGPAFKMRRDPRTTRFGRFLRWSSIDELPQLLNVLRGDMSLVGPRPLPTDESQACQGWQRRRLDVTPGMTCTWQVTGRGKVRFDDWVRMDLRYADRRSLWHDLKLVLATVPSLIVQRGMR